MHVDPKRVERDGGADEILEPLRAARFENDVYASGIGDEIPNLGAPKRCGITAERQSLRHRLRVNTRTQVTERGGKAIEVFVVTRGCYVGACGEARKALEARRSRPHQDIANAVARKRTQDPLRIEWTHGDLRTAVSK